MPWLAPSHEQSEYRDFRLDHRIANLIHPVSLSAKVLSGSGACQELPCSVIGTGDRSATTDNLLELVVGPNSAADGDVLGHVELQLEHVLI